MFLGLSFNFYFFARYAILFRTAIFFYYRNFILALFVVFRGKTVHFPSVWAIRSQPRASGHSMGFDYLRTFLTKLFVLGQFGPVALADAVPWLNSCHHQHNTLAATGA